MDSNVISNPNVFSKGEYYIKEGRSKSLHYGRYIEDFGGSVYIGSMNLPGIGSEMIGGFECTIWNFYFDYMGAALGHSKSVNVGNGRIKRLVQLSTLATD